MIHNQGRSHLDCFVGFAGFGVVSASRNASITFGGRRTGFFWGVGFFAMLRFYRTSSNNENWCM